MPTVDQRYAVLLKRARKAHKAVTGTPRARKWTRRTIIGIALITAWGTGHDSGVAEQAQATPQAPTVVQTAPKPQAAPVKAWQEDEWPSDLMLWAGCNTGPCDIHTIKVPGHRHCLVAVNETSMTRCPDGYYEYS